MGKNDHEPIRESPPPAWARALADVHERHPRRVLAFILIATALCAWPLAHARFSADLTDLLPAESAAVNAFRVFREAFGQGDQIVVVALEEGEEEGGDAGDGAVARAWIGELRKRLETRPEVRRVEGGPLETLTQFATAVLPSAGFAWLTPSEAAQLRETLTPAGLARAFARDARLLEQSPGLDTNDLVKRDPLFLREILGERAAEFLGARTGQAGQAGRGMADVALLSISGHRPAQDLETSRAIVAAVNAEIAKLGVPEGIRLLKTGGYSIAVEDEARIRHDLESSTITSIGLVLVLFFLGYRGLRPLLFAMVPLVVGVAWGYGLFIAMRGTITMITAIGAAMLVGLCDDFGVHFYAELQKARREGLDRVAARRAMIERAAPRIAVAGLTSAGCFFAFAFTGFRGLSDLGLLAGVGLVACLASFLLVFPLMIGRHDPKRGKPPLAWVADGFAAIPLRWPKASLGVAAAATAVAIVVLVARGAPPFVADSSVLHPKSSPAMDALAELDRVVERPLVPWVVLAQGEDADELSSRLARLEPRLRPLVTEGVLDSFELPSRALPPCEAQRATFAELAALDPEGTERELRAQAEAAGFDPEAFAALAQGVRDNLARANRGECVTLEDLRRLGAGALADTFFRPVGGERGSKVDLKGEGESRFEAAGGRGGRLVAAAYLFPLGGLLPGPEQQRALERVEQALAGERDLALTGFPVVAAELGTRVREDFRGVTWLALAIVVLLVLASSRSFVVTALALVPVAIALLWLTAAMRLLGSSFNVMNIVLLPMIVGLGVDNGVHLVFDTRASRDVAVTLRSMMLPMLLSTVTTVAGFSSFGTVQHPAIASMGELTAIGTSLDLIATVLVLTPLLRWLVPKR